MNFWAVMGISFILALIVAIAVLSIGLFAGKDEDNEEDK